MATIYSTLFLIAIVVNLFTLSISQDFDFPSCDQNANFTTNSTYQRNLNEALSSVTSDTSITYGFYNRSVGQTPNQVNAVALCRGDFEPEDCRRCINNAITRLRPICPNQKGAIGWYYNCMIRYSNSAILGVLDYNGGGWMWNINNASNVDEFNQDLYQLLDGLRTEASSGGSLRKYASNETNGPRLSKIYGLMQCTPDLSQDQCFNCLNSAIQQIPNCCDGKRGGRVIYPSCYMRYEDYIFFNDTVVLAPPPSPPSTPPTSPPLLGSRH